MPLTSPIKMLRRIISDGALSVIYRKLICCTVYGTALSQLWKEAVEYIKIVWDVELHLSPQQCIFHFVPVDQGGGPSGERY